MGQFLFVVEVPPNTSVSSPPGYPSEWTKYLKSVDTTLKQTKVLKRLQLNAWLISAEGNWLALESLAASAKVQGLSYSILSVDNAIELTSEKPASGVPRARLSGN